MTTEKDRLEQSSERIETHPIPAPKGGPYPTDAQLLSRAYREVQRLTHERDVLADALGRVLVAAGVVSDVALTGPELLLAADDLVRHCGTAPDGP